MNNTKQASLQVMKRQFKNKPTSDTENSCSSQTKIRQVKLLTTSTSGGTSQTTSITSNAQYKKPNYNAVLNNEPHLRVGLFLCAVAAWVHTKGVMTAIA